MITIVEPTPEIINQLMDKLSNEPEFSLLGEIGIQDFSTELGFENWQACAVANGVPVGIITVSDGAKSTSYMFRQITVRKILLKNLLITRFNLYTRIITRMLVFL